MLDRAAGKHRSKLLLDDVEQRVAIAGHLVADVVHEPRVAVDRHQVAAGLGPEQPVGDGEVLAARLAQQLLRAREVVRGERPRHRTHRPHRPSAITGKICRYRW
jgi:hypothetical protein